jgi:hypothetical protein
MQNENMNDSIHGKCAFDSKEIAESDSLNEKHNEGTISGQRFWCRD